MSAKGTAKGLTCENSVKRKFNFAEHAFPDARLIGLSPMLDEKGVCGEGTEHFTCK